MIDMQGYDVGDALRCACGEIIGREESQIVIKDKPDKRREIVITCEHCASMLIMVIVPPGGANT